MDLLEQSHDREAEYKPFFFMLINTNTRFAYAYPMEDKSTGEVVRCLEKAWDDTGHKLKSIVCDDEPAFSAADTETWYNQHKVSCKVIANQNHTALAVVDRLIRTLRDMNTPTIKSEKTSEHPKYRDFSEKRMRKLIKIYNATENKGTKMKPETMKEEPEEETKYIIRRIYQQERRHKIKDYELEKGYWVRYILPKDPMKKHRYKISPEAYQIKGRDGHSYIIMAKDGSTLSLSRWRLLPLGKELPPKMKVGATLHRGTGGIPKGITRVDARRKRYLVQWEGPDGAAVEDTWEPIRVIRELRTAPGRLHKIERAFWHDRQVPDWVK
jgi:hypothetical protein